jgi:hypothetical protein
LAIFEFDAFIRIFSGLFNILLMRKNSNFFKGPKERKVVAVYCLNVECGDVEREWRTLSSGPDTR